MLSPKYSVITPVFNRENKIERCIKSVAEQNLKDYEHIIVDDGSVDGSVKKIIGIVDELNLTNVSLHANKKNNGVNYARNQAIKNAKGKYLILLDSDDYFKDQALDIIDSIVIANKKYQHYMFSIDCRLATSPLNPNDAIEYSYSDWLTERVTGDFVHVIERDLLVQYPFFEDFKASEILNWLRVFRAASTSIYTNIAVVNVDRTDKDSLSRQGKLHNLIKIKEQIRFREKYFSLYCDDLLSFSLPKYNGFLQKTIILQVACGDYSAALQLSNKLVGNDKFVRFIRLLCAFRLGFVLRQLIYLKSKLNNF